jgi:hypothetical protein
VNVTIISAFRNSVAYIPRYFDQMGALAKALAARGDWLHLILGYGDSTDGTGEMLFEESQFSMSAMLVEVSHGGEIYGSIEHPQRFKQLAYVGNRLLDLVPPQADVVGIVESDLRWQPETMVQLIDHLAEVPAVAPMIMDGPNSFYDSWGFRRDGVRFTKTPPYYPGLNGQLFQVDSAGSVLFVRGDLARKARLSDGEAIIGFCDNINQAGGSIWLDPTQAVQHPPYGGIG